MINKYIIICSLSAICMACSSNIPEIPKADNRTDDRTTGYKGMELSWSDEFEAQGLPDNTIWEYEEGYQRNNELQDYKREDLKYSHMYGGNLVLEIHPDQHEGTNHYTGYPYFYEYSSASLTTRGKMSFSSGRLDISAKIPVGKGVYPSIRLYSESESNSFAEIDIMEYVWADDPMHPKIYTTVNPDGSGRLSPRYAYSNTLDSDFHLYSVILEEDRFHVLFDKDIIFTYDNTQENVQSWPWGGPFYLSISLAAGGQIGGSTWGVDNTIFPKTMEIEYVRHYTTVTE